jgi:hypothetical protein
MDGLSRWDLVLWIVALYAAVTVVMVAIHRRHIVKARFLGALRHINRGFRG